MGGAAPRCGRLREFLGEVGAAWPGDPVLAEVGRSALPADDARGDARRRRSRARMRDRVAEVYGLGEAPGAS